MLGGIVWDRLVTMAVGTIEFSYGGERHTADVIVSKLFARCDDRVRDV